MEKLVNKELVNYIENNIKKIYKLNGESHGIEHVETVLNRAYEISKEFENLNYNILYTAVIYHDIGDHIDRENHEIVSAQIMEKDVNLDKFFTSEEKQIIKEAIEDHRSSKGKIPRNIYGKILASADKNVDINLYFKRSMMYTMERFPDYTKQEVIEKSYEHAIKKFGRTGYAVGMYFVKDRKYEEYLEKLWDLIDNKDKFFETAGKVYDQIVETNI